MKKPLEMGLIEVLTREICEYIECYNSSDFKRVRQYIDYNLSVLESDAKRALQKALSISEPLLQYIDSPSDVVYESNLGIHESDENYLLTTSICAALNIILTIKYYHYLNNVKSDGEKCSFSEMIKELRDKVLIYRGIELEEEKQNQIIRLSILGKNSKGSIAIPAMIGNYVRDDLSVKPRYVWNSLISLIRKKDGRLKVKVGEKYYTIYSDKDPSTDDIYLCEESDDLKKEPKRMKFHSAFEDHVKAAKKHFQKKKLRST